ncbi:glycosyltransferase, partial [mine drainage metagenome]
MVTYEPDPELLRDCVQSVVDSDYRPLELVVVDNGSRRAGVRDQLEGLLAGDPEVSLVFSAQSDNLGYAAATNVGVELGRGELVLL